MNPNMTQANLALDYVKSRMTVGASNKIGDFLGSFGASYVCVLATRSVKIATPSSPLPAWVRSSAAIAEHVGCGNCGENAGVAFVYLYDRGVFPIDFMAATNHDHAFVVIGRDEGGDETRPEGWGKDAVICDPWDGKCYPASDFRASMYKGSDMETTSMLRANSASDVQ